MCRSRGRGEGRVPLEISRGGGSETPTPHPLENSHFTNLNTSCKVTKKLNELCKLEKVIVGIYNSGSIGEPESQYLFILVFGFSVKYLVYSFIGLASAFI